MGPDIRRGPDKFGGAKRSKLGCGCGKPGWGLAAGFDGRHSFSAAAAIHAGFPPPSAPTLLTNASCPVYRFWGAVADPPRKRRLLTTRFFHLALNSYKIYWHYRSGLERASSYHLWPSPWVIFLGRCSLCSLGACRAPTSSLLESSTRSFSSPPLAFFPFPFLPVPPLL